jgi:exosortase
MPRQHPSHLKMPPSDNAGALTPQSAGDALSLAVCISALGACLVWTYWPTLLTLADRWSTNPQYSHGFLVPLFAAAILWHRRALTARIIGPSLWGFTLLVGGIALRLVGTFGGIQAMDAFSLLPSLAGLILLIGGKGALRWGWPAIAFLIFMLPLPFVLETALAHPLQRLATISCTYLLQTLGYPALGEGNIIYIDDVKLGVVGACSGLGMLMTFFALSTAVAMVVQRPLTDKLVITVSAIPIAVIANVVRIAATGVVHCEWGQEAGAILHDWAGWLMMPLALGLLWMELRFLDKLLLETSAPAPLPVLFKSSAALSPNRSADDQLSTCNRQAPSAPSSLSATANTPGCC